MAATQHGAVPTRALPSPVYTRTTSRSELTIVTRREIVFVNVQHNESDDKFLQIHNGKNFLPVPEAFAAAAQTKDGLVS